MFKGIMKQSLKSTFMVLLVGIFFVGSLGDADAQRKKKAKAPVYKPFIHAYNSSSDLGSVVDEVKGNCPQLGLRFWVNLRPMIIQLY